MPQVSLFGEQSLTLVAATFADQATAAEAAASGARPFARIWRSVRQDSWWATWRPRRSWFSVDPPPQSCGPMGCRGSSEESCAVGLGGRSSAKGGRQGDSVSVGCHASAPADQGNERRGHIGGDATIEERGRRGA